MATEFDVGDQVRLSVSFKDASNVAADPTGVVLKIMNPWREPTTYTFGDDPELEKDSTGNYHADIVVDLAGYWAFRFEGSGVLVAVKEASFTVLKSQFS